MNLTEKVLSTIEYEYLKRYGFDLNLIEHVEYIYFTDVSFGIGSKPCEQVFIEQGFKNPKWESFDILEFEKLWQKLGPDREMKPIFL